VKKCCFVCLDFDLYCAKHRLFWHNGLLNPLRVSRFCGVSHDRSRLCFSGKANGRKRTGRWQWLTVNVVHCFVTPLLCLESELFVLCSPLVAKPIITLLSRSSRRHLRHTLICYFIFGSAVEQSLGCFPNYRASYQGKKANNVAILNWRIWIAGHDAVSGKRYLVSSVGKDHIASHHEKAVFECLYLQGDLGFIDSLHCLQKISTLKGESSQRNFPGQWFLTFSTHITLLSNKVTRFTPNTLIHWLQFKIQSIYPLER